MPEVARYRACGVLFTAMPSDEVKLHNPVVIQCVGPESGIVDERILTATLLGSPDATESPDVSDIGPSVLQMLDDRPVTAQALGRAYAPVMLGTGDLVAFVPTSDLGRAGEFYGDVLGLDLVGETPVALLFNANSLTAVGPSGWPGAVGRLAG